MSCRKNCLSVLAVVAAVAGCSADPAGTGGTGGTGGLGTAGSGSSLGTAGTTVAGGTAGTNMAGGTAGTAASNLDAGAAGTGSMVSPTGAAALAQQFPAVTDWTALQIIYPTSYSGFDGVHTFKVPMRVRCNSKAMVPLSGWTAVPATAVTFDADPDNVDGVMVTIVEPTAEITIGVVKDTMGGSAPLHVTIGTPEQWALGDMRYHTGADWTLNILMPMAPPPNTKCTVCHGANSSSGFDVQHTPTQAARISDEGLTQIMTTGTKPADVPFRVIPPEGVTFAGKTYTPPELYMMFHLWDTTADGLKGMILYLRSLTPTGQGCVTNPMTMMCTDVTMDAGPGGGECPM